MLLANKIILVGRTREITNSELKFKTMEGNFRIIKTYATLVKLGE